MNTTTATRYTPDDVILRQCYIPIPDNERGLTHHYPGLSVEVRESSDVVGFVFHDGNLWCWKTPNASAYGRHEIKRYAIAALLDAVQP